MKAKDNFARIEEKLKSVKLERDKEIDGLEKQKAEAEATLEANSKYNAGNTSLEAFREVLVKRAEANDIIKYCSERISIIKSEPFMSDEVAKDICSEFVNLVKSESEALNKDVKALINPLNELIQRDEALRSRIDGMQQLMASVVGDKYNYKEWPRSYGGEMEAFKNELEF